MSTPRLVADFASPEEFLSRHAQEMRSGGLLVRGAVLPPGTPVGPCVLEVRVPGQPPHDVPAQIAASIPGVGVAVLFQGDASALAGLAAQLSAPAAVAAEDAPQDATALEEAALEEDAVEETEEPPPANALMSARLAAMTVSQKMQLALSGDREARAYLLRDTNKTLHVFVLRNPRIGLDEVLYAAKLPSLSPEALKLIAEHREWGGNAQVCTALARNPRMPLPLVFKLLPRVPVAELRAIAKGTGRLQVVQAARKLLAGPGPGR
jgi:hypothetical protein